MLTRRRKDRKIQKQKRNPELEILNAGGGVLYKVKNGDVEVLLIYRNDVWDLPKGKQEPGEIIEETAKREVAEETGIGLPETVEKLGITYHEYVQNGTKIGKNTTWFAMKPASESEVLKPQLEEGIDLVRWHKFEEAEVLVGYKNLKDVLSWFKIFWNKKRHES